MNLAERTDIAVQEELRLRRRLAERLSAAVRDALRSIEVGDYAAAHELLRRESREIRHPHGG